MSEAITRLIEGVKLGPSGRATWLPEDSSRALLVCIGAGPWIAARRIIVQQDALRWYESTGHSDLSEMISMPGKVYPLDWQNKTLHKTVEGLWRTRSRFSDLCAGWAQDSEHWELAMVGLFDACGAGPDGLKVLWMFARDHLGLPAFPVDRHIRRVLTQVGLPTNPWVMTRMCIGDGLDPSAVNRGLFPAENPVIR